MQKVERVCPNCGTANPYESAYCRKCGTNLTSTNLPARRGTNSPARFRAPAGIALVVSASAFLARLGLKLLARQVLPRVKESITKKPEPKEIKVAPREEVPDTVIRGWRAWSVRKGEDESSGSEKFEWRINSRGKK